MVLPIVIAVIILAGYFFTQSKSKALESVKKVESYEYVDKLKKEIKSKEKKGREELKKNISTVKKYQKKSKEKSSKETHKERAIREAIEYPSKAGNSNLKILLKDKKFLDEKMQVNVLRNSKPKKWLISLQGVKSKYLKNYNLPEYEVTRIQGLAFKNKYKFSELKDQYGSYGYSGFMSLTDYLKLKFD
jgi:hypothetical protein